MTRKPERRGRPGKPGGRFGHALARARRAAGLTQARAARRLGVSTNTLSRWERGETAPCRLARRAALAAMGGNA